MNETFKVLAVKDTNLDSVASNLHISPRTLNRKLKQESVSFRRLFDKYRLELSLTYLTKTTVILLMSLTNLASQIRAHSAEHSKNWTGHSPTELKS